ncbi:MAG: hypothetical protein WEE64_07610 [Dehalococcoidia bacterium]
MGEYEVYVPQEGQARRFYESLNPPELEEVQRLLYEGIEKHPLAEDPLPRHLTKISLPVGPAQNGVLCTDGKYYFYYHFPQEGIVSVVYIDKMRPPPFTEFLLEQ